MTGCVRIDPYAPAGKLSILFHVHPPAPPNSCCLVLLWNVRTLKNHAEAASDWGRLFPVPPTLTGYNVLIPAALQKLVDGTDRQIRIFKSGPASQMYLAQALLEKGHNVVLILPPSAALCLKAETRPARLTITQL